MKQQKLTVFTPTYNRVHLLPRVYKSLCAQTCQNFVWLIVDDGSTDGTAELVTEWQKVAPFEIQYIYQENQGMHGAHNTAYETCTTDFNVCIDSDDFMPANGVEEILKELTNIAPSFAGLIGLDADEKTLKVIGTRIPEQLKSVKINELYALHHVTGDKKLVYRTAVVRQYPKYPLFEGEGFVPLDYLYLLIDQDYDLKPVNEIFCIVEYQQDGSTKNILKQYRRHPNGFAFSRVFRVKLGATFKERFRNAIHLVSSCIFAHNYSWLSKTGRPFLVALAFPFGILLNGYIRLKTR